MRERERWWEGSGVRERERWWEGSGVRERESYRLPQDYRLPRLLQVVYLPSLPVFLGHIGHLAVGLKIVADLFCLRTKPLLNDKGLDRFVVVLY